jgi:hypothetical protein
MKMISKSLLPILLSVASFSTSFAGPEGADRGGIPTRDITPSREKHYIDRTGTKVFVWDPIGADPRSITELYFDVDGAREFQRLPLHLGIGDVAFVTACGTWKFSAGGKFYSFGPGGDGSIPEWTLAGYKAATGCLLMDVHYSHYRDHYSFSGPGQPIAIHGPCDSLVFIAHDQLASAGADGKDGKEVRDYKEASGSLESKGVLHVRVQILDPEMVAEMSKEGKGFIK